MMKKIKITDLGINGEGIGKENGKVVFVPFSMENENVTVEIINEKKDFSFGKLISVETPSQDRTQPPCEYFGKCGGCDIQHFSHEKQLDFKKNLVERTIKKIAKVNIKALPTVSENEYNYRTKMVFPVVNDSGKTKIGMFEKSSHRIVEIKNCLIATKAIQLAYGKVRNWIETSKIEGYDFEKQKGFLKYVVLKENCNNTVSCVFVVKASNANHFTSFAMANPEIIVYENENPFDGEILGRRLSLVSKTKAVDNPLAFSQINTEIKNEIYSSLFDKIGKDVIINGYSGSGELSFLLSKKAKKVYGIELSRAATNEANLRKQQKNISNVENICGKCEVEFPKLFERITDNFTIIVDPPRAGLDKTLCSAINSSKAKTILYMSCNPASFSRDLSLLSNFTLTSIQPFDMFPQTSNVEILAKLTR